MLDELALEVVGEGRDAIVVEAGGRRAEDGHVLPALGEVSAVAQHLARDIAMSVQGTATVELVDRDDIGVIQHVDLLELARGAELGSHDVEREVSDLGDRVIALADAGSLDDHEVVAGECAGAHRRRKVSGHRALAPRGDRAHEDPVVDRGIHADAIAEECATAARARGIDGEDRDAQLPGAVEPDAPDDLVGEAGLAGSAGARDAEDRHPGPAPGGEQGLDRARVEEPIGDRGEESAERDLITGHHGLERRCRRLGALRTGGEHVVDHADETQTLPILRRVDADIVSQEKGDLIGKDDTAPASIDAHVVRARVAQAGAQVGEVLDVTTLVGRHGNAVGILMNRCAHDVGDAPVVPEVDHLRPLRLQDATHDGDGCVVAVEEAGSRDEAQGPRGHACLRIL